MRKRYSHSKKTTTKKQNKTKTQNRCLTMENLLSIKMLRVAQTQTYLKYIEYCVEQLCTNCGLEGLLNNTNNLLTPTNNTDTLLTRKV